MEAIATSAQEQSVGLSQVNTAVNQMDQTTQQNAAMVEEASASSTSLAGEAEKLRRLVGRFQLSGASDRRPATAVRPASEYDSPASSPVRALGRKIASAFNGNAAVASREASWEDF